MIGNYFRKISAVKGLCGNHSNPWRHLSLTELGRPGVRLTASGIKRKELGGFSNRSALTGNKCLLEKEKEKIVQ